MVETVALPAGECFFHFYKKKVTVRSLMLLGQPDLLVPLAPLPGSRRGMVPVRGDERTVPEPGREGDMRGTVAKRLRKKVWGPDGSPRARQHFVANPIKKKGEKDHQRGLLHR